MDGEVPGYAEIGEIEPPSQRIHCLVLGQKVPLKYSGETLQVSAVGSRGERPVQAGEWGAPAQPTGNRDPGASGDLL